MTDQNQPGKIIVIAGPTCSGESTITRRVMEIIPRTEKVITTTSRKIRPREKNNIDYHFISKQEFERKIQANEFLEYIKIPNRGDYYGTDKKEIEDKLKQGINVILNLDWQGAEFMKKNYLGTITIFIQPDSLDVIKQRLHRRDPNISQQEIQHRIENAQQEIKDAKHYDYVVINYDGKLNQAIQQVVEIIQKELINP